MNSRNVIGSILAVVVLAGGVGAGMYRAELQHWVAEFRTGPGMDGMQPSSMPDDTTNTSEPSRGNDTPAGTVVRIDVGAKGFSPETLSIAPGADQVLEFTRTADRTCATAVVFPATGKRFDLPLNSPVRVPVSLKPGETIAFSCPMDMYHGKIVASGQGEAPGSAHMDTDAHDPSDIAHWTCSMHPSVKSATPGKCPICSMDLISVTHGEIDTGVILVDARRRQLIGVTTGTVARREMDAEIRAVGRVVADETRLAEVTLRYEAWIGKVFADFTGKEIRKGEPMFTFYNPQLWSLQEEYLEALRRGQGERAQGGALASAAETRLRLWGIDEGQIEALRQRGSAIEHLTVSAPITGTILVKHIVAGGAVQAGEALYRIADLTSVWIEAEVYEQDIARMKLGQRAKIRIEGLPEREFEGTVSYVYPSLDAMTRTGRVRVDAPNADGALKLDMYAEVRVALPLGERLAVPESAVIHAGASHVAFVDLGEGRLEPRRLKVGARTADYIEVLEGLKEGETIVTSANFLIAAESKLKSGIEKW